MEPVSKSVAKSKIGFKISFNLKDLVLNFLIKQVQEFSPCIKGKAFGGEILIVSSIGLYKNIGIDKVSLVVISCHPRFGLEIIVTNAPTDGIFISPDGLYICLVSEPFPFSDEVSMAVAKFKTHS